MACARDSETLFKLRRVETSITPRNPQPPAPGDGGTESTVNADVVDGDEDERRGWGWGGRGVVLGSVRFSFLHRQPAQGVAGRKTARRTVFEFGLCQAIVPEYRVCGRKVELL